MRLRFALVILAGALMFQGADAGERSELPGEGVAQAGITVLSDFAIGLIQDLEPLPLDTGALGRWLSYLAVFLMIGAVAFVPIARRGFRQRDEVTNAFLPAAMTWSRALGLAGSIMFLLAAGIRLYAQVVSLLFPGDPVTADEVSTVLFDTVWGTRWLIQVSVAVVAGLGFAMARRGWRPGNTVAWGGALGVAVTLPLTGHAMAASWHWGITWPLQALHVLAGAAWLGSLLVVTVVGFGATVGVAEDVREQAVFRLIGAFSPAAVVGVAAVVLAGAVLSVSYVGSWAALWQTTYGRVLLVKIVLLAGTGLVGAYNWRRLRPRLGAPGSAAQLRFSARVELVLGALLLGATAILVALPAPHV